MRIAALSSRTSRIPIGPDRGHFQSATRQGRKTGILWSVRLGNSTREHASRALDRVRRIRSFACRNQMSDRIPAQQEELVKLKPRLEEMHFACLLSLQSARVHRHGTCRPLDRDDRTHVPRCRGMPKAQGSRVFGKARRFLKRSQSTARAGG